MFARVFTIGVLSICCASACAAAAVAKRIPAVPFDAGAAERLPSPDPFTLEPAGVYTLFDLSPRSEGDDAERAESVMVGYLRNGAGRAPIAVIGRKTTEAHGRFDYVFAVGTRFLHERPEEPQIETTVASIPEPEVSGLMLLGLVGLGLSMSRRHRRRRHD